MSSPGDVVEERNQAKRVIERLQLQYPDVVLEPVLWEEMALEATESFQVGIDRKVSGGSDSGNVEEVDNFQGQPKRGHCTLIAFLVRCFHAQNRTSLCWKRLLPRFEPW